MRVIPSCLSLLCIAALPALPAMAAADTAPCWVVESSADAARPFADLQASATVSWWVEIGPELVVCGEDVPALAADRGLTAASLGAVDSDRLWVSRGLDPVELMTRGFRVLASAHRYTVLEEVASRRLPELGPHSRHVRLAPLAPDSVVLRRSAAVASKAVDPAIQTVVDQVDGPRWFADVTTLQEWDRYTSRSEILTARDWLAAELGALPGMDVTTPSFPVGASTGYNVIGVLTGTTRPDDLYVVGGHYDATSLSCGSSNPAHGAEDNATGAAGVLELARVLSANPPEATVVFIAFGGEEQGLYGSEDYVADLTAAGQIGDVQAAVIMDMIGYSQDATLDVLLETESLAVTQQSLMAQAAADYTDLVVHTSLNAWGSDHVPFLDADRPAVLTIDDDWDLYPYYHCTTDTIDKLSGPAMGLAILRMNAASLAEMAGAAASPAIFEDDFETGDTTAWSDAVP